MIIHNGKFSYRGFGNCPSFCNLTIYTNPEAKIGPKVLVTMVELSNNPGTSVTNASELIADLVFKKYLRPLFFRPDEIYWAESSLGEGGNSPRTWDSVTYDWNIEHVPVKAHWKPAADEFVRALMNSFTEATNGI